MPEIISRETLLSTPWFCMVAKTVNTSAEPYYIVEGLDYVSIVARTHQDKILLVKQYRPAVECYTLELVGGHVEHDETPEDAARRELLEETGYETEKIEFIGELFPDTGRLGIKQWCFFIQASRFPKATPSEKGVEPVHCDPEQLLTLLDSGEFNHALSVSALLLGVLKGKFALSRRAAW